MSTRDPRRRRLRQVLSDSNAMADPSPRNTHTPIPAPGLSSGAARDKEGSRISGRGEARPASAPATCKSRVSTCKPRALATRPKSAQQNANRGCEAPGPALPSKPSGRTGRLARGFPN